MPLNSRHRGIDPRHAFLPPVYCVHRLTSDDEAGWRRVPPVPLLSDLFGEETPLRRAEIKLAFADHRLLLRAVVVDDAVTCHPERDVGDTDFWRQDHIELRVLPNPERDMDTCQFLFTAGGRFLAGGDSHVSVDYRERRKGQELGAGKMELGSCDNQHSNIRTGIVIPAFGYSCGRGSHSLWRRCASQNKGFFRRSEREGIGDRRYHPCSVDR